MMALHCGHPGYTGIMNRSINQATLIAGPTASGKSCLALQRGDGRRVVIINADSMQVYRDLRVLTARPSVLDEAEIPHRLYGHVCGTTRYSTGAWLRDMAQVLRQAREQERYPIVVGGTGLYFKALTQGLAAIPLVPEAVVAKWRRALAEQGEAALYRHLSAIDAASARHIDPGDGQRISRALEVMEATGRGIYAWQQAPPAPPLLPLNRVRALRLMPDREALYARIDKRFDAMIENGALDEVERLMRKGLDSALPIMKAHGVPHLMAHLRGQCTLDEAAARSKRDTRRYAKRQFTWMRGQMQDWEKA